MKFGIHLNLLVWSFDLSSDWYSGRGGAGGGGGGEGGKTLVMWFCIKKTLVLACIQTFTDGFLSNVVWWWTDIYSINSVSMCNEETQTPFVMVDYVREMSAQKSCKYNEYASFVDLLFLFAFDPYEYHMELCNESYSAIHPNVLHGKNFNVGHYMQNFQPFFVMPSMLIATFNFYHVIHYSFNWPWLLAGAHKVSAKQNQLA